MRQSTSYSHSGENSVPEPVLKPQTSKEVLEGVEMKRFIYQFRDPQLEATFMAQQAWGSFMFTCVCTFLNNCCSCDSMHAQEAKQQGNVRQTITMLILFTVFRLTESVVSFHGAVGQRELWCRVAHIVLMVPAITLSYAFVSGLCAPFSQFM